MGFLPASRVSLLKLSQGHGVWREDWEAVKLGEEHSWPLLPSEGMSLHKLKAQQDMASRAVRNRLLSVRSSDVAAGYADVWSRLWVPNEPPRGLSPLRSMRAG